MMTMRAILVSLVFLSIGCGDDGASTTSGVMSSKRVADLTDPEVQQFCSWGADVLDAPRTVQCGDDQTVSFDGAEECVTDYSSFPDTCEMTVSQAEACVNALADDPCGGFGSSACAPLLECAFSGG